MTELKTLEELPFRRLCSDEAIVATKDEDKKFMLDINTEVKIYDLKQEAIKWINHFKSGNAHTDFAADGRNDQENIEEWIKHFFNLTAEDLK